MTRRAIHQQPWPVNLVAPLPRRAFLARTSLAAAGLSLEAFRGSAEAKPVRMTLCLSPGAIGVNADQRETIRLAAKHGFTAVEPFTGYLAGLDDSARDELLAGLKAQGLSWGAAGLPVDIRADDARFEQGLAELPRLAAGLQRCAVTRVGTWISPGHSTLAYAANFERHRRRLSKVAQVLQEHRLRLGLEFVGTPSARARSAHPFIHDLAGLQTLIAALKSDSVGVVLDSWHWWSTGGTQASILALRSQDVVAVDLNDALAGLPLEQQQDGQRELPAATGVIAVGKFLGALRQIGCDAPIRAEPFNRALNALDNDEACAATIAALRRAMAAMEPDG